MRLPEQPARFLTYVRLMHRTWDKNPLDPIFFSAFFAGNQCHSQLPSFHLGLGRTQWTLKPEADSTAVGGTDGKEFQNALGLRQNVQRRSFDPATGGRAEARFRSS